MSRTTKIKPHRRTVEKTIRKIGFSGYVAMTPRGDLVEASVRQLRRQCEAATIALYEAPSWAHLRTQGFKMLPCSIVVPGIYFWK